MFDGMKVKLNEMCDRTSIEMFTVNKYKRGITVRKLEWKMHEKFKEAFSDVYYGDFQYKNLFPQYFYDFPGIKHKRKLRKYIINTRQKLSAWSPIRYKRP